MDSANAAGYRLTLLNKNGACVVQFEGQNSGQSSLLPKPPCYFLRRESEHPQSFSYPDVRTQAVLIVVGTAATEKTRKLWKLPPDLVCGEEIQAVLVRENAVRVSKEVRDPGVACRDKGVDEKEFWAFAHDEP